MENAFDRLQIEMAADALHDVADAERRLNEAGIATAVAEMVCDVVIAGAAERHGKDELAARADVVDASWAGLRAHLDLISASSRLSRLEQW